MDDNQEIPNGKIAPKILALIGALVVLFFLDASGIGMPVPRDKAAATLFEIFIPDGGEVWEFGSQQEIKWQTNPALTADVYLISEDSSQLYRKLLSKTENDGSENWIIDIPTGRYKIQIKTCPGCSEGSNWDTSNSAFTVTASESAVIPVPRFPANESLIFFSPTGGEEYRVGNTMNILWFGGYEDWQLTLTLVPVSPSSSTPIYTVAQGIQNDGKFEWTVPSSIAMGNYYLRLDCSNCASDITDAFVYTFNYITLKNY